MTDTREYSLVLARVDSPNRGLIILTYEDGTTGDDTPRFESVAAVREAFASAAVAWGRTKSGARFLKRHNGVLNAECLQELLNTSPTRASLIAELKKQGLAKVSVIGYAERDIAKDWPSDLNLVD